MKRKKNNETKESHFQKLGILDKLETSVKFGYNGGSELAVTLGTPLSNRIWKEIHKLINTIESDYSDEEKKLFFPSLNDHIRRHMMLILSDEKYMVMDFELEKAAREEIHKYLNKSNKGWREDLFKAAKEDYDWYDNITLKESVLRAFEQLPDKDNFRKEFEIEQDNIIRTFRDRMRKGTI